MLQVRVSKLINISSLKIQLETQIVLLCSLEWTGNAGLKRHDANANSVIRAVSSIYIWSKNLVAKSEAKDGGN